MPIIKGTDGLDNQVKSALFDKEIIAGITDRNDPDLMKYLEDMAHLACNCWDYKGKRADTTRKSTADAIDRFIIPINVFRLGHGLNQIRKGTAVDNQEFPIQIDTGGDDLGETWAAAPSFVLNPSDDEILVAIGVDAALRRVARKRVADDLSDLGTITVEADDTNGLEADMDALKYSGFDPVGCRKKFCSGIEETDEGDKKAARLLIKSLIVYSRCGNNTKKITYKVVDQERAKQIKAVIVDRKIMMVAKQSNDLTLARLALCFMPVNLCLRIIFSGKLQDQTKSSLDVVYKDISFIGCPEIAKMGGYEDFYNAFGEKIARLNEKGEKVATSGAAKMRKIDDDEKEAAKIKFASGDGNWKEVAEEGYNSDDLVKTFMKKIFEDQNNKVPIDLTYTFKIAVGMINLSNRSVATTTTTI